MTIDSSWALRDDYDTQHAPFALDILAHGRSEMIHRCDCPHRPLPGVELGIAASAILLGLAVLAEWRPPLIGAAILVGLFAIFHGYAHGAELPAGQNALLYSMGFVVATGCLHGVGIAVSLMHRWPWGQRLLRMAGAGIAMAGDAVLVLEYTLTPGDDRREWLPRVRRIARDGTVTVLATVEKRAPKAGS